jgi:hypothetical protein
MNAQIQMPWKFKWTNQFLLLLFIFFLTWFGLKISLKIADSAKSLNQQPLAYTDPNQALLKINNLVPPDLADYLEAIAVDSSGAIYAVGKTRAPAFPLVNPFQATYSGGDSDGFIAVLAPDGQSLQYSTYIGGSDMDIIKDIAISDSGQIIVVGATGSADFPLVNPYQSTIAGFVDGFVMVFEPNFQNLKYSTFVGGDGWDYPTSMTTSPDGSVHLTGYTDSITFPVLNPIQTYQGDYDVFVTGIAPEGQSLIYSTYLGGPQEEQVYDIAIDSNGRKYIAGSTFSSEFPVANAFQPVYGGFLDGFVTVLSPDGGSLEMSTFLGGGLGDSVTTIQIGDNDRIYVAGATGSNTFPLVNPYQPIKNAGGDGFLSIFNPDWQSLAYSTYLGGNQGDTVQEIAVSANGNFYALGYTYPTDFPLTNPLQPENLGIHDIFLTSFAADGQSLIFSTYLGGSEGDSAYSISLDTNGSPNIGGVTWSHDFPMMHPYQSEITGSVDGFISIVSADGQSLQYSTYLGGSYPGPTDVSLNQMTGTTADNPHNFPAWIWLLFGLIIFLVASLSLQRLIRNNIHEQ